jgi:hypothetical protein
MNPSYQQTSDIQELKNMMKAFFEQIGTMFIINRWQFFK